jgi:hypothetical protein
LESSQTQNARPLRRAFLSFDPDHPSVKAPYLNGYGFALDFFYAWYVGEMH